jgi:hypothetical protein
MAGRNLFYRFTAAYFPRRCTFTLDLFPQKKREEKFKLMK